MAGVRSRLPLTPKELRVRSSSDFPIGNSDEAATRDYKLQWQGCQAFTSTPDFLTRDWRSEEIISSFSSPTCPIWMTFMMSQCSKDLLIVNGTNIYLGLVISLARQKNLRTTVNMELMPAHMSTMTTLKRLRRSQGKN
jgi:hypothetical protein